MSEINSVSPRGGNRQTQAAVEAKAIFPGSNPGGDTIPPRPRRKLEIGIELAEVRDGIRRAEAPTTNPATQAIRERALRRLYPREAELAAEFEAAPEDAPKQLARDCGGSIKITYRTTPLTAAEVEAFPPLPECLRRTA